MKNRTKIVIALLFVAVVIVYAVWTIREPSRRARQVHDAIRSGMNYSKVEPLLTGRYYSFFQVNTNGQWATIPREAFAGFLATTSSNTAASVRLQLHFMGTAPQRVSFCVYLDNSGNVTNTSKPYGWD